MSDAFKAETFSIEETKWGHRLTLVSGGGLPLTQYEAKEMLSLLAAPRDLGPVRELVDALTAWTHDDCKHIEYHRWSRVVRWLSATRSWLTAAQAGNYPGIPDGSTEPEPVSAAYTLPSLEAALDALQACHADEEAPMRAYFAAVDAVLAEHRRAQAARESNAAGDSGQPAAPGRQAGGSYPNADHQGADRPQAERTAPGRIQDTPASVSGVAGTTTYGEQAQEDGRREQSTLLARSDDAFVSRAGTDGKVSCPEAQRSFGQGLAPTQGIPSEPAPSLATPPRAAGEPLQLYAVEWRMGEGDAWLTDPEFGAGFRKSAEKHIAINQMNHSSLEYRIVPMPALAAARSEPASPGAVERLCSTFETRMISGFEGYVPAARSEHAALQRRVASTESALRDEELRYIGCNVEREQLRAKLRESVPVEALEKLRRKSIVYGPDIDRLIAQARGGGA